MRLGHIIEQVYGHPWLITQTGYRAIIKIVESKLLGDSKAIRAEMGLEGLFIVRDPFQGLDANGFAWIDIYGALGHKVSPVEKSCGVTDYNDLSAEIDQACELNARGLIFTIDSPGGSAGGCPELAQKILSLDLPKVAFIDSQGCSAAYWLACSCDYIVATPSAQVGSIGAMIPWVDQTALWVQAGLRWDPIISAGAELKTAGGGPSLSDAERAYLVQMTNKVGQIFSDHVTTRRGIQPADLKGTVLFGDDAMNADLVDELGDAQTAYDAAQALAALPDDDPDDEDDSEDGNPVLPYQMMTH